MPSLALASERPKSNVDVHNTSTVSNNVGVSADTGHNTSNENTVGGNIHTGDVNTNVSISNETGSGWSGGNGGGGGDVTVHASNTLTGPHSNNENEVTINQTSNVDVHNTSTVSNNVNVSADTGHDTSSENTVGGNIHAGDVNVGVHIHNQS